ncbi:uncharacterized protein BP01DRAFT_411482 [Aspergillus saccharolyticus JOP 1030-1]|uniref:Uncharacterized protein n=1 Tax=Aspergillus saccharolyticus JOP 1030-1 TaxID=1450539 RepID=A0A318Z1M3_9EURO|nr:hypothetical protein BP01DRAFT_411482 [Aspergillus saccharolyticus JOP 1030-1]PYH40177.1 hypothetical protein BP01DRAFT_411482 [Aspergillus saccharolyticus JOP 1030-1]
MVFVLYSRKPVWYLLLSAAGYNRDLHPCDKFIMLGTDLSCGSGKVLKKMTIATLLIILALLRRPIASFTRIIAYSPCPESRKHQADHSKLQTNVQLSHLNQTVGSVGKFSFVAGIGRCAPPLRPEPKFGAALRRKAAGLFPV